MGSWRHPSHFCWQLRATEPEKWHNSLGDEGWDIPLGTAASTGRLETTRFHNELFSGTSRALKLPCTYAEVGEVSLAPSWATFCHTGTKVALHWPSQLTQSIAETVSLIRTFLRNQRVRLWPRGQTWVARLPQDMLLHSFLPPWTAVSLFLNQTWFLSGNPMQITFQ